MPAHRSNHAIAKFRFPYHKSRSCPITANSRLHKVAIGGEVVCFDKWLASQWPVLVTLAAALQFLDLKVEFDGYPTPAGAPGGEIAAR